MEKREILRPLSKLGLSQSALRIYDELSDGIETIEHHPSIDWEVAAPGGLPEPRGDVFIPLIAGSKSAYRWIILGHAFRLHGYVPRFLQCHSDLDLCMKKKKLEYGTATCEICQYTFNSYFENVDYEVIDMADVLSGGQRVFEDDDKLRDVEYNGIDISKFALGSTRKMLKRHTIDLDAEPDRSIYRRYLNSSVKLVDATNAIFDEYDVKATMGSSFGYIYAGIPLSIARNRGISPICVQQGYLDQSLIFGNYTEDRPHPKFTDKRVLDDLIERPLSRTQKEAVDEIMSQRFEGGQAVESSRDDKTIETDDSKTTVGMFTNVIWEGSLTIDGPGFDDVLEWIEATIELLENMKGVELFVKTHPAELLYGTNERVSDLIDERFDELNNVIVLPPDSNVNTYKMVDDIDTAIVYRSTVGLEASYIGTPVIVSGYTHYRDLGFTYDVSSTEEIEAMLHRNELPMTDEMTSRLYRLLHFVFQQKHIHFPFYEKSEDLGRQMLPVTPEGVRDWATDFDFVINQIINDKPVYRPLEKVEA